MDDAVLVRKRLWASFSVDEVATMHSKPSSLGGREYVSNLWRTRLLQSCSLAYVVGADVKLKIGWGSSRWKDNVGLP